MTGLSLHWPSAPPLAAAWSFWLLPSRWLHPARQAQWQLDAGSDAARHRLASQAWLARRGDEAPPEVPALSWALALWPVERCPALWRALALAALAPRIRRAIVRAEALAVAQALSTAELATVHRSGAATRAAAGAGPARAADPAPLAARLAQIEALGAHLWLLAAQAAAPAHGGWQARLQLRQPPGADPDLPPHPPLAVDDVQACIDALDPTWRSSFPDLRTP